MFTGIITDIGRVDNVERRGDLRLRIACGYDMGGVDLGASIACSGVCLTVVDKAPGWFAVDVSAETLKRTAAGTWDPGARLNLERALKVGDELGGHIVTGHVDGVGEIVGMEGVGDSTRLTIRMPDAIAPFVATKGSITVDGISLTVNRVEGDRFDLNIIPHTAAQTNLADAAVGREVNLEIDVLARYLARMLEVQQQRVI